MKNDQEAFQIMTAIKEAGTPVGATYLTTVVSVPPATIGRIMQKMEKDGLLAKVSNKGRVLTDKGIAFLEENEKRETKLKTAGKLINILESGSKAHLLEVLDIRKYLEGRSASLAAANAAEEQLHQLDEIMLEYLVEIRHGGLGSEQDLQLHLTIAKMSGNYTIYQILKLLLTNENAYTKFSSASINQVRHTQLQNHENIVNAIKAHEPDKARYAMEHHLDQVIKDVKEYFPADNH